MLILALDPGTTQTGWCRYDSERNEVDTAIEDNADIFKFLPSAAHRHIVIEECQSYGMAIGQETITTIWFSGRLYDRALRTARVLSVTMLPRKAVKLHLCGSMRAKDTNIRAALIDRFGGIAATKKGGALHGVRSHSWAALALAVTYADTRCP